MQNTEYGCVGCGTETSAACVGCQAALCPECNCPNNNSEDCQYHVPELHDGHRKLLDSWRGKDLICAASHLREEFGLSEKDAGHIIKQWMDEPAKRTCENSEHHTRFIKCLFCKRDICIMCCHVCDKMKVPPTVSDYVDRSLISGTHNLCDLLRAFTNCLQDLDSLNGKYAALLKESHEWCEILRQANWIIHPSYEETVSMFVNESLINALNDYAPDGYYFGTTPGDGSDFGFWQMDENWESDGTNELIRDVLLKHTPEQSED